MTPQEREQVAGLFDRLAKLESGARDGEAEAAIAEGLKRAPNAVYALVQSVLVQDEALKRADARIRELEAEFDDDEPQEKGFLDNMRDSLFGRREPQGSVPSVPAGERPMGVPPGYRSGMQPGAPADEGPSRGGSFLGTAAAAAAGVIGGAFLLDGIRSMMGQKSGAFGAIDPTAAGTGLPWSGSAANSDLARQAGLGDIGGPGAAPDGPASRGHGLFGDAGGGSDDNADDLDDFDGDFDVGDFGSDP